MQQLIDTHGYIGSNQILKVDVRPEQYRALQKESIASHNLSPRFLVMTYSIPDNFNLPDWVDQNPDLFLGGIAQINPNRARERIAGYISISQLESLIKTGKIVAIKLNTAGTLTRVDDPSVDDFAKVATDYNIPLVVHCSATGQKFTHPDYFRRLKDRHPDLTVVCAHYGGLNENYTPSYIHLIHEFPDIFLNTVGFSGEIARRDFNQDPSIVHHDNTPERWIRVFLDTITEIQDRVVFGTDFPELRFTLHPVDQADKAVQEKLFYHNPVRVFRLEDRIQ